MYIKYKLKLFLIAERANYGLLKIVQFRIYILYMYDFDLILSFAFMCNPAKRFFNS